jgi:hypothetical protein
MATVHLGVVSSCRPGAMNATMSVFAMSTRNDGMSASV